MKITVIGATGLIGSTVVDQIKRDGHEVVASLSSGANVLTGEGLTEAVAGAQVLVDVVNSPSFEDGPVMDFFTASSKNLVAAAQAAGVGHYVALSIVNADGLPESGYMRAKVVQERTIVESGLPYTIVRATQFHQFAEAITGSLVVGDEVRVPDGGIQLIAAADVAAEVARVGRGRPRERHRRDRWVRREMSFARWRRPCSTTRATTSPSWSTRRPPTSARTSTNPASSPVTALSGTVRFN